MALSSVGCSQGHLPTGIAMVVKAVAWLSVPLVVPPLLLLVAAELLLVFALAVSILPRQLLLGGRIALLVTARPSTVWHLSFCFTAQESAAVGAYIAASSVLTGRERDLSRVTLAVAENAVTSPGTIA